MNTASIAIIVLLGVSTVVLAAFVVQLRSKRLRLEHEISSVNKLLDASMALNSCMREPEELLEVLMEKAVEVIGAEASSVILKDETKDELYFKVATGEKRSEVKEIRLRMGEGIAGWVAMHGKPLKVDEVASDTRWSSKVSAKTSFATRNLICVPIKTKAGVIGVVQLINKVGKPHFSDQDVRLLESITMPAGIALENARLYEELSKSSDS